jgi:hypothetical protein
MALTDVYLISYKNNAMSPSVLLLIISTGEKNMGDHTSLRQQGDFLIPIELVG